MKVAVIGSRNLVVALSDCIPAGTTEILSGGARGVDTCAQIYAEQNGIVFREFLPDYERFGRSALFIRNDRLISTADMVIAFWDGKSRSTKYAIDRCRELNKPIRVYCLRGCNEENASGHKKNKRVVRDAD